MSLIITRQWIADRCVCLLSSKCECVNIILYLHIPFLGSYVFVTAPEEGHRAILVSEFIQSSQPRWVLCLLIVGAVFQQESIGFIDIFSFQIFTFVFNAFS